MSSSGELTTDRVGRPWSPMSATDLAHDDDYYVFALKILWNQKRKEKKSTWTSVDSKIEIIRYVMQLFIETHISKAFSMIFNIFFNFL